MQGAMVGGAEHHELVGVVVASVGAGLEVVEVDVAGMAAAGDDAAAGVAAQDLAADAWGDGLAGALHGTTHVGRGARSDGADVFAVARLLGPSISNFLGAGGARTRPAPRGTCVRDGALMGRRRWRPPGVGGGGCFGGGVFVVKTGIEDL
jgi:hypothetical protein